MIKISVLLLLGLFSSSCSDESDQGESDVGYGHGVTHDSDSLFVEDDARSSNDFERFATWTVYGEEGDWVTYRSRFYETESGVLRSAIPVPAEYSVCEVAVSGAYSYYDDPSIILFNRNDAGECVESASVWAILRSASPAELLSVSSMCDVRESDLMRLAKLYVIADRGLLSPDKAIRSLDSATMHLSDSRHSTCLKILLAAILAKESDDQAVLKVLKYLVRKGEWPTEPGVKQLYAFALNELVTAYMPVPGSGTYTSERTRVGDSILSALFELAMRSNVRSVESNVLLSASGNRDFARAFERQCYTLAQKWLGYVLDGDRKRRSKFKVPHPWVMSRSEA